jgi:hypothetical protein
MPTRAVASVITPKNSVTISTGRRPALSSEHRERQLADEHAEISART